MPRDDSEKKQIAERLKIHPSQLFKIQNGWAALDE
jgi:DNA-directed RNA polymerase subunit H (RpoH/RPB5)